MEMYNLLVEASDKVEVLTEQTDNGKQLYIEGIFAQQEVVNGNNRLYPKAVMESAMDSYMAKYVNQRRALGELNHPEERPFVDPAEAAIRITEMRWDGNNVYGKALVLNTPKGQTVKGLLEGGFNMGVSTRALGTLKEKNGIKIVQPDLMFTAVDCVDNPSAPDAHVHAVMESKWMVNESGMWVPVVDKKLDESLNQELFFEKLKQYIKGLKK